MLAAPVLGACAPSPPVFAAFFNVLLTRDTATLQCPRLSRWCICCGHCKLLAVLQCYIFFASDTKRHPCYNDLLDRNQSECMPASMRLTPAVCAGGAL
eukprot:1161291-Pelagomonas_calceolata.AAC.5